MPSLLTYTNRLSSVSCEGEGKTTQYFKVKKKKKSKNKKEEKMIQFLFLFPFFQHVDHFKTLLIHLTPHLMGPDPVESNVFPLTHNTPTLNCLINIAIELHFSHTSFFLFLHFCSLLSSTQRCWKSPWRRKPGVTMDLQEAED